jgi:hypothetical protein
MEPFIEVSPGKLLRVFNKAETKSIEKKWIDTFCKNKLGLNIKRYKWHIFCGEGYPSIEGDLAEEEYSKHISPRYVVMSNDGEAFLCDKKPDNLNYQDAYVFPENLSWTMAFTHEEGWMGPYFAKHKDYVLLEEKNKHHLEKLKQIELAKSKGWM